MRNNYGRRNFMHTPFSFQKKLEKLQRATNKSPQNVVLQGVGVRAVYHLIWRLSSTLSCNKTLVINFFFFTQLDLSWMSWYWKDTSWNLVIWHRYIGISYFTCNFHGNSSFLVADAAIMSILLPFDSAIHLFNYFLFTK